MTPSGRSAVPPGWPPAVPPPAADGWQRAAGEWLLDLCPPDYRGYAVLRRHLPALAWLARHHVDAGAEGCRRALADARAALGPHLPAPVVADTVEVVEEELARLLSARRALDLVRRALDGDTWVPRL